MHRRLFFAKKVVAKVKSFRISTTKINKYPYFGATSLLCEKSNTCKILIDTWPT